METFLFLDSLSWLWDDLTKSPRHIALTVAAALFLIDYVVLSTVKGGWDFHSLLHIIVGCLEVYGVSMAHEGLGWMLDSGGNFCFAFVFSIFLILMMMWQYLGVQTWLEVLGKRGNYNDYYYVGIKSVLIFFVYYQIRSLFGVHYSFNSFGSFEDSMDYVIVGLGVLHLWIFGHLIYSSIKNGGRIGCALLSVFVYIFSLTGLFFMGSRFWLPMVLLWAFAWSSAHPSPSKKSRHSGETLDNGTEVEQVWGDKYRGDDGYTYTRDGNDFYRND